MIACATCERPAPSWAVIAATVTEYPPHVWGYPAVTVELFYANGEVAVRGPFKAPRP